MSFIQFDGQLKRAHSTFKQLKAVQAAASAAKKPKSPKKPANKWKNKNKNKNNKRTWKERQAAKKERAGM